MIINNTALICRSLITLFIGFLVLSAAPFSYSMSEDDLAGLRKRNSVTHSSPDATALQIAKRMGLAGDIDALKEIVALNDAHLLGAYVRQFQIKGELSAEIEKIIVELIDDTEMSRAAIQFIGRWSQCNRSYRTRELFDALYSTMVTASDSYLSDEILSRIVCTSLTGMELRLAEAVAKVKSRNPHPIIDFLVKHRSLEALPLLEAAQRDVPTEKGNFLHSHIDSAFLVLDTPESLAALFRRIKWIGQNSHLPGVEYEVDLISGKLLYGKFKTPILYENVRPLLSVFPASQSAASMMIVAANLGDPEAVRDLMPLISGPYGNNAVSAILAIGDPADWSEANETIKSLGDEHEWNSAQRKVLRDRLARAVADPDKVLAERSSMDKSQKFRAARSQIDKQYADAGSLRESDPIRYVAATEQYLLAAEKLLADSVGIDGANGLRLDTVNVYRRLASYVRFSLADSQRAAALYEQAIALSVTLPSHENMGALERMGLADTLRFDLNESGKALEIYQALLVQMSGKKRSTNSLEAVLDRVFEEWVRAEVEFLKAGNRYLGTPDRDTLAGVSMILQYGSETFNADDLSLSSMEKILRSQVPNERLKRDFASKLERLSPSQLRILGTFDFLPLLGSSKRVADYVRRHDPAGFLTACVFGLWHLSDHKMADKELLQMPESMNSHNWSPSESTLMRSAEMEVLGRHIIVRNQLDPKLATPESTWTTFVDALRTADLNSAWKCTSPGIRNKFEQSFGAMSPSQLKEMADSITGIKRTTEFGDFVEAVVVRANGHAGFVTFERQGKEWFIVEM